MRARKEVGATEIRINYYVNQDGHVFEVRDDGCGMDYNGDKTFPGRLDRFLGLGLSAIVGQKSDEFSWKGLGSKLAYQSKRVEIETYRAGDEEVIKAEINDPWGTISANRIPKPRIYKFPPDHNQRPGTRVVVVGHPPHRREEPFTIEEIETFLQHRTFVGFTRERETRPRIYLTVTGEEKELSFRFPELLTAQAGDATILVNETEEGKKPGTNVRLRISMKGFYTWDAEKYNLSTTRTEHRPFAFRYGRATVRSIYHPCARGGRPRPDSSFSGGRREPAGSLHRGRGRAILLQLQSARTRARSIPKGRVLGDRKQGHQSQ